MQLCAVGDRAIDLWLSCYEALYAPKCSWEMQAEDWFHRPSHGALHPEMASLRLAALVHMKHIETCSPST